MLLSAALRFGVWKHGIAWAPSSWPSESGKRRVRAIKHVKHLLMPQVAYLLFRACVLQFADGAKQRQRATVEAALKKERSH